MSVPIPTVDPYEYLKISLNPDGTLTRSPPFPTLPPSSTPSPPHLSLSKDIPLNPSNNTSIRLFRPTATASETKLPVIIYFHGGGFIYFSTASAPFHHSCARMAFNFPCLVVSVDYRLAPEYRLPAAYEDAADAIAWVFNRTDEWLNELADFRRVFLMGASSGGNIVYHAALRSAPEFKITGVIMNQPFFGGVERTEKELEFLYLCANDLIWELALPEGADRDHEYCNPVDGGDIGRLPRCFVWGFGGDAVVDRKRKFVRMLEARGVEVVRRIVEGGYHGLDVFEPNSEMANDLYDAMKDFVNSTY